MGFIKVEMKAYFSRKFSALKIKLIHKEILFQALIAILLAIFVGNDKHGSHFMWREIPFLINYVLVASVINYVLLPRYLYKKRTLAFWLLLLGLLTYAVFTEELVLEKIFYPKYRGRILNIFSTFIEVSSLTIILVSGKFAWDAIVKQQKIDSLKRTLAESELDYLKQQINPHFLFNNLNNLYAYAIENSPKTPEIILQLSSILRYMLYDCKEKTVSLFKEEQNINAFIQLNKLQLEGKGKVNYSAQMDADYYIAPLILIVFIENAFKHSQASQSEGIEIDVNIEVKEAQLVMRCSNTFGENKNSTPTGGIGLQNVKTRLEMLYPQKHQLYIKKEVGRYSVQLEMNLKTQEK